MGKRVGRKGINKRKPTQKCRLDKKDFFKSMIDKILIEVLIELICFGTAMKLNVMVKEISKTFIIHYQV